MDYSRSIDWLLKSNDPSVRYFTLVDLLRKNEHSEEVKTCRDQIPFGPKVTQLLSNQQPDGGFSVQPYRKWIGSHWRLVSLVKLGVSPLNKNALQAAREVMEWIYGKGKGRLATRDGKLPRMHASVYGNALGVLSKLGFSEDPRTKYIADIIISAQWPDGGWNCDPKPSANHSSFHESLATLWGLIQYNMIIKDKNVSSAIDRASELFLSHRIFRSHTTGEVVNKEWLKLIYPVYWHYNSLEALKVLSLADKLHDVRASEALDLLESKCTSDGVWNVEGTYWYSLLEGASPNKAKSSIEVVDWGRKGPNEMITLNALRVLSAANRIKPSDLA